ncbi:MobV family relaxase [Pseudomonas sp. Marseille-P8916]|uniref:MobV family relaxase n=1 Tax=Pseudomonas sp. Marseille-P8916 TaxID=2866589 RepID=UPI001CE3D090|nr:MobV family relaxase [Pseudomonas sp. Marseille-P8916]
MYAIIRTQKHKTLGAISRSAKHTFRELPTPNAASSLSSKNVLVGVRDTGNLLNAIKGRLPTSRRRDAVLCIEYLITASAEAFSRHGGAMDDLGSGYFRDAFSWLRERHGKENVICAAVHLDERTPHLVAYVVPITKDGRLSARDFLGGATRMRQMQDSFHATCGKPRGLLRGVKGSKAYHSDISKFYAALTLQGEAPKLGALDYVAKAAGYETKAWQSAQSLTLARTQELMSPWHQRKAIKSRLLALERAEASLKRKSRSISLREGEIDRRERASEQRERQLSVSSPVVSTIHCYPKPEESVLEQQLHLENVQELKRRFRKLKCSRDNAPR